MTRLVKLANNAVTRLAGNITNVATTLSVTPGEGAKFPTLSAGQFFMATLANSSGNTEVIKVTARSTDTFTFTRAAEPVGGVSTAYAFTAGDRVEMRLTAGALGSELDRLDAAALISALNKSANYTVTAADVTSLVRVTTTTGAITITLPQISTLTDDFDVVVAKVTSDTNNVLITRSGSDLINGSATYALASQWQCAWLIADRSTNTWTAINSGNGIYNTTADRGTGSGSASILLSGDPVSVNNTAFFVGGVYQQKNTYSLSGTTLNAGGAIPAGVGWEVVWSAPVVLGVPSDGSVSTAKLADQGVTAAKLNDAALSDKTHAAASKATPVDTDEVGLVDSAASFGLKRLTWANLKATLKTYFDTLYASVSLNSKIQPVIASVAANALTVKLNPTSLDFRSTTLTDGVPVTRSIATQLSLTVPNGATLGTSSGLAARLMILAIDNAGTVELAIMNLNGGQNVDESGLISTTSISVTSDSDSVAYSAVGRSNVAYRVVGYVDITELTAGTWASSPTLVQGAGGQAGPALASIGYAQKWQDVFGSRAAGTTYYNTTGKPIQVNIVTQTTSTSNNVQAYVSGVMVAEFGISATGNPVTSSFIVPSNESYSINVALANVTRWAELR